MSLVLVLNALGINEYLRQPLADAPSAGRFLLDRLVRAAEAAVLAPDRVLICGAPCDQGFLLASAAAAGLDVQFCPVEPGTTPGLLAAVAAACTGGDTLVWLRADAVLASPNLAALLLADHRQFRAEFTFAEGYPAGYGVQILDGEILPVLQALAGTHAIPPEAPDLIFDLIKKDINNFAIETRLSRIDHRLLRVDFHAASRLGHRLCANHAPVAHLPPDDFEAWLDSHQEGLRTLPAFMNVQILETCPQVCSWCPHALRRGAELTRPGRIMPVGRFLELCGQFQDFAPGATVSLSLWGEPALHPEIYEILAGFGRFGQLGLLVETSGIGWDRQRLATLAATRPGWLRWVLSLDSTDPGLYRQIRGDGFEEAQALARDLPGLFPGQVWIQAVRTTRNEDNLPDFVKLWKERQVPCIIQKYDHFSLSLPDLRVSDISPLKRLPCWHLKRDLHVLVDGRVTRCREDLEARDGLGNVFTDGIPRVWAALEPLYHRHLRQDYPDICGACDESYTFNF